MKMEALRQDHATAKAKVKAMEEENTNLEKGMKEIQQELIKFSEKGMYNVIISVRENATKWLI